LKWFDKAFLRGKAGNDAKHREGIEGYNMNEPTKISAAATTSILAATKKSLSRNGGKQGGWASKHQVDAILTGVAEENGSTLEDYDGSVLREVITFFSNASATAQYMEKNGVIDKRTSRVAKRENIFAGFTA